jgi:tetratricopeptide (TPR) repeat protein
MIRSGKFINICIYLIAILIVVFLRNSFAEQEDPYLQRYFTKAISLFDEKRYEEAIKAFEYIIKVEKSRGEAYFTPFAEIYIDKSKEWDSIVFPRKKDMAALEDESMDEVYKGLIDYYEENRKVSLETSGPIAADVKGEEKEEDKEVIASKKTLDESGWTRIGAKSSRQTADLYAVLAERPPDVPGWTRLGTGTGGAVLTEAEREEKIAAMLKDEKFREILYKRIDSGLENLDDNLVMFFEDQRFRNIVRTIRTHKLRNK